jgi:predicted ATPase
MVYKEIKLYLENFGSIKKGWVELKPLTLFMGEDDITISLLLDFFGNFLNPNQINHWLSSNPPNKGLNAFLDFLLKEKYSFLSNAKAKQKKKIDIEIFKKNLGSIYTIPPERKFLQFLKDIDIYNNSSEEELVKIFENQLLGGKLKWEKGELMIETTQGVNISYKKASAKIKSLLPFYLLLKNSTFKEGDLIIYQLPELGLHPKKQVELLEFLTLLINKGYWIIIYTNSPYITDHLSNLINAINSPNTEKIKDFLFLKNLNSLIPLDKVTAYTIENGELRKSLDKKNLVNWETFSKISDKLTAFFYEV